MVKQTFYNLTPQKRTRIINAIINEIDGKTLEDISINQIVKNAGISRGSFYQYFDDKQDVFKVVMQGFSEKLLSNCVESLKKNGGDLFLASTEVFDFLLTSSKEEKYSSTFKTVFSNAQLNCSFIALTDEHFNENSVMEQIKDYINYDLLNENVQADVKNMIFIISSVIIRFCFEVFVIGKDENLVKEYLQEMFLLMKNGFYRR